MHTPICYFCHLWAQMQEGNMSETLSNAGGECSRTTSLLRNSHLGSGDQGDRMQEERSITEE